MPVNAQMTQAEVDHVVADAAARLVVRDVADLGGGQPLHRAAAAAAGDVAAVLYTSGTTGKPKGAPLTHRALVHQARAAAVWPSSMHRDEAVIALPVAHIMGFAVVLGLAMARISVYFLPRFRPEDALDAIEQRRATIFVGVPAMYRLLLEAGAEERDLRSVRLWASGADVMPPDLAYRFQRMGATVTLPLLGASVGGALFIEGYGMVEVGGAVAATMTPPIPGLPAPPLLPLPNHRFKVVDEDGRRVGVGKVGELMVKGPGTGDWVRTGDLVRRGPLGLFRFAGRSKDVIKSGGYSVYALEVQSVLEAHEAVAEAAVVGVPDERMGERVAAAVRLVPGGAASEDELAAWCRERLSAYKVPAIVRIVDDLPRTGTGKVRKTEVAALFTG